MSKNLSLAFNILLLILVGILFYLHFSSGSGKTLSTTAATAPVPAGSFRIAYFEMDSIENNYNYLKDVKEDLKTRETDMNNQLNALKNRYSEKVNKFQQEAQSMSQEKQGAMQQELMDEQRLIQNKEQSMGLELQDQSFKKMQEVNKTIEGFLREFNKDKGYTYILAHQPGLIYYKDSTYDLTAPILKGLNEQYKKKK